MSESIGCPLCVWNTGVQNLRIYDAIFRSAAGAIDHYLLRHEYAATLTAPGFAHTTGYVGVALTVPGPGGELNCWPQSVHFCDINKSMKKSSDNNGFLIEYA